MTKALEFSVLMSVYSKENPEYLKESLDSILIHQSVLPNEVVLVEDGPLTRELSKVVEDYQKKFKILRVYALEDNVGLGKALNYGLGKCSYEWVARMDTDDIANPKRFEYQLEFITQNPLIDVVGSNILEFGTTINDIVSHKELPQTHDEIVQMSKSRNPMCHVTIMFKKSSVQSVQSYLHLPYVEDYYLWIRMINKGYRFANLNKDLVYVRIGNGMYARRGNREQIASWKKLNGYMFQNNMISKKQVLINMLLIRIFVYMPTLVKKLIYTKILRSEK